MKTGLVSFWDKQISAPLKSRIAPTPSGFIHLGNELNFILTWLLVRANQGKLLLRIDDMDRERFRLEYLSDLFSRLEELGINWDEGPESVIDFESNWSQTCRLDSYWSMLDELLKKDLLYPCFCSRKTQVCHCDTSKNPIEYPELPWRIKSFNVSMIDQEELKNFVGFQPKKIALESKTLPAERNFVVKRRDGKPAYQICSLADDLRFGTNLLVRGEDLLGSSFNQLFLAKKIGQLSFLDNLFVHHPLTLNNQGIKLSKSTGNQGPRLVKQKVFETFGNWMGWKGKPESLSDCLEIFSEQGL